MTIGAVRDLVMRLNVSSGALAALGVALEPHKDRADAPP